MTETTRQPVGQWCWCDDPPENQPPHDCAEDHATRAACQSDGAHVHPWSHREQQPREHDMTGDADRVPYDVHSRLEDPMGVLAVKLGVWGARDGTRPQPGARRAAGEAMTEIDRMLAELHAMRARLVAETRLADDASAARADALLSWRRAGQATEGNDD